MSDYRYQIKKHNGIDCLHVLIDGPEPDGDGGEIIQTHIPIDDILASLIKMRAQEYQPIPLQPMIEPPTLEQIRAVVREELEAVLGSGKPEELMDVPTYTIGTTITGDEPCSWCGKAGVDGSNIYCRRCKKWYCSLHYEAH